MCIRDRSSISINDKAEIAVGNDGGKILEGSVIRKSESTDTYTGTFTVDIKLNSKDYTGLASGMFGKATIKIGKSVKAADTWAVPYDALLDGDGSTGYLFVTNDGKTAQRVRVTIGGMKKDEVIITDGLQGVQPVSYTHLDVYKRQLYMFIVLMLDILFIVFKIILDLRFCNYRANLILSISYASLCLCL